MIDTLKPFWTSLSNNNEKLVNGSGGSGARQISNRLNKWGGGGYISWQAKIIVFHPELIFIFPRSYLEIPFSVKISFWHCTVCFLTLISVTYSIIDDSLDRRRSFVSATRSSMTANVKNTLENFWCVLV